MHKGYASHILNFSAPMPKADLFKFILTADAQQLALWGTAKGLLHAQTGRGSKIAASALLRSLETMSLLWQAYSAAGQTSQRVSRTIPVYAFLGEFGRDSPLLPTIPGPKMSRTLGHSPCSRASK